MEQNQMPQQQVGTQVTAQQSKVELLLRKSLESAIKNMPLIEARTAKAIAALSTITGITNDQQDEYANNLLAKVRATYETDVKERKEFTEPLDEIKKWAMAPEKTISTDAAAKDSVYNKVKGMRDEYANKKLQEAKAEKDRIKLEQDQKDETTRVRAELARNVTKGITSLLTQAANYYSSLYTAATLETLPDLETALARVPLLKVEAYNSFFSVMFDARLLAAPVYSGLITEAKQINTYESCNNDFITRCSAIIAQWKEKVPDRRNGLLEIAELEKTNSAAALAKKEAADASAKEIETSQTNLIYDAAQITNEAIDQMQESEKMDNAFDAQVGEQAIEMPKGVRVNMTARLDCPEEETVVVIAEMFYQCFTNPAYYGIVKKDRKGMKKFDENGNEIYVDWLQDMLDFVATYSDKPIKGIRLIENAKSIAKAR